MTEKIALCKETIEWMETLRDTVRRTEVDIEGDAGARPAGRLSDAWQPWLALLSGSVLCRRPFFRIVA